MTLSQLEINRSVVEPQRSLVCIATEQNRRYSEASLLVRAPGSYLLAYTTFAASARDDAFACIEAIESTDHGATWSDPIGILEKSGGINVMAPSMLRLTDGSVGLAALAKQSLSHTQLLWLRSYDDGLTWSEPTLMLEEHQYTVCLNDCLLQMSSGRLLFPVYSAREAWSENKYHAFCLYSDDMGNTWHRSANIVECPGRGAMEPVVFERSKNHVVMLLRTDQGHIWTSESLDGGVTWKNASATSLESPQAPCMVKETPDGSALVLIRNSKNDPNLPSGGPRVPLTISLSLDHGTSWRENIVTLEDSLQATFSYPSISFDEGNLLLTYYVTKFRSSLCETPDLKVSLCFRRIPLESLGNWDAHAAH